MSGQSRKDRGYKSQALVADWFASHGHPFATSAGAGRQGRDVLGTLGLAIEVKARRDLSPMAWLRQAASTAAGDLPLVVFRCDGQGEAALPDWGVLLRLEDFTKLSRAAGYGDTDPDDTIRTQPEEKPMSRERCMHTWPQIGGGWHLCVMPAGHGGAHIDNRIDQSPAIALPPAPEPRSTPGPSTGTPEPSQAASEARGGDVSPHLAHLWADDRESR